MGAVNVLRMSMLVLIIGLLPFAGHATSELVYRRYLPDTIITLDPTASVERYSQSVILQIYDPLFKTEDGITPIPHIAQSFSYDASTRTYSIILRNDVYFHDDIQLTADDVVFTFERLCRGTMTNVSLLAIIQGCKGQGEFGVRKTSAFQIAIRLSEDFPPFASLLSSPHFMVLPKDYHGRPEQDFFLAPVGTGPFRIQSVSPDQIVLTSNVRYFRGAPRIQKIVSYTRPPEKIYDMLQDGAIDDIFPLPPPPTYPDRYEPVFINQASSLFLAFRPNVKPYHHKAIREAIRSAINNDKILAALPAKSGIIPAHGVVPWAR